MAKVQRFCAFGFAAFAAIFCLGIEAQSGDPAAIQQKLVSEIKLTKATADRSDIVTAGDVLVLQKDGLTMCSSSSSYAFGNTYSNGCDCCQLQQPRQGCREVVWQGLWLEQIWIGRRGQRLRLGQQCLPIAEVCRRREVLGYRDHRGQRTGS